MKQIALILLIFAGASHAAQQRRSAAFELEISEANVRVAENRSVELAHSFVSRLQVHVLRTPQQINYGSVALKVNGESANIIMTTKSETTGMLCELDLNLRAGFRLLPGRNSVEASAVDFYGRRLYATFLVDIRSEGNSGSELRTETSTTDPLAGLPQIKLASPSGALSKEDRRVVFEGVVVFRDRDWTLSIAGRPLSSVNETAAAVPTTRGIAVSPGATGNAFPFRQEVSIPEGATEVRVEVETRAGNRAAVIVPVGAAAVPLTEGVVDKYAVVIGVSRYRYARPGFPNLQYARADAAAFRDFLLSQAGGQFRPTNVITLFDEDATILNVRTALFTFLTRSKENDQVVIYFAGHGAPDPNNPNDLYFLAHDSDPANMAATALPMWQMRDLFARTIKTKRVVTFADACHSAGAGAAEDQKNLINQYVYKYASADGRAIITASDIGELSEESEKWGAGHGVFTYFLLQAL